MLIKTNDGKVENVPLLNSDGSYNVSKENYTVPQGEEGLYHVLQEQKQFSADTGKRLSRPVVQKYGKKEFETIVERQLRLQKFTMIILHEPSEVAVATPATATPVQQNNAEVDALRSELAKMKEEMAALIAAAQKPSRRKK